MSCIARRGLCSSRTRSSTFRWCDKNLTISWFSSFTTCDTADVPFAPSTNFTINWQGKKNFVNIFVRYNPKSFMNISNIRYFWHIQDIPTQGISFVSLPNSIPNVFSHESPPCKAATLICRLLLAIPQDASSLDHSHADHSSSWQCSWLQIFNFDIHD